MAKKFKNLVEKTMTPQRRARAAERTKTMLVEMHLAELRRARDLSQVDLAERFGTTQPEISKIEARSDVYISTLRKYIEAAGGRLEIVARFPDSDVRINQFSDIAAGSR
jgi:ribosome-binding protein aMBF1 (putative translation factor)